jgi:hypothetical protein
MFEPTVSFFLKNLSRMQQFFCRALYVSQGCNSNSRSSPENKIALEKLWQLFIEMVTNCLHNSNKSCTLCYHKLSHTGLEFLIESGARSRKFKNRAIFEKTRLPAHILRLEKNGRSAASVTSLDPRAAVSKMIPVQKLSRESKSSPPFL